MSAANQSKIRNNRGLRRWFSFLAWFVGLGMATLLIGRLLLGWFGQNPERLEGLMAASESPWLMGLRYLLYVGLWFGWRRLIRFFDITISDELILRSRRPLLVLMVGYELLFGLNVLSFSV